MSSSFLSILNPKPFAPNSLVAGRRLRRPSTVVAAASSSPADPNPYSNPNPNPNPKPKSRRSKLASKPQSPPPPNPFPATKPRKPRRGRRGEAGAVEDFIRDRLERTFESIREQGGGVFGVKEPVLKERRELDDDEEESESESEEEEEAVVEEEDPNWPLDADVGWGIRASEYFEKHPIRNVVEDGVEIDWEGEMEQGWVKEINCLEWESFAFHPSPIVVLVFERYNRASDNWKVLKELEKAAKVYWGAKDHLPPRTVKIDINIERDLAYALNVKEGPELLFLRGNFILYREKGMRTADELVKMIAFFYYNARRPPWIDPASVFSPF